MPMYAFRCPDCNKDMDKFFHVNDEHKVVCPGCGQGMKKNYGAMSFAYHDVPVDSVDTELTGDPIVYHTRGQLKRIAKEHGCSVDFGTMRGISNQRVGE